jgi:hypothetical protein
VVALVQPWSQEGFREATSAPATSSSQWPGRAPQLQSEAVAALLVLASLGKGSSQLVAREAEAVSGLLKALSDQPWQWQQQQQQQEDAEDAAGSACPTPAWIGWLYGCGT